MIGFVNQSYATTEGEEFYFSVGVTSNTRLGREVVVVLGTQSDSAEGKKMVYKTVIHAACSYNFTLYVIIGGQDFNVIKDYLLTFGPSMTLDSHSIHILPDGHYEKDEHFNVTLSARILSLDLNSESIELRSSICQHQALKLFSVSNETTDADKVDTIDLDRVHLTQTVDGLQLILASNESDRIIVSPAVARVTIMDNNSM